MSSCARTTADRETAAAPARATASACGAGNGFDMFSPKIFANRTRPARRRSDEPEGCDRPFILLTPGRPTCLSSYEKDFSPEQSPLQYAIVIACAIVVFGSHGCTMPGTKSELASIPCKQIRASAWCDAPYKRSTR